MPSFKSRSVFTGHVSAINVKVTDRPACSLDHKKLIDNDTVLFLLPPIETKKTNCIRPLLFQSQRVVYQSSQKL